MYDPVSLDTVLINDAGDLLVGLSDGNVINAGRARGLQGPQGERGLMGMRGESGKNGVNGAQWYTGVGLPDIGLGGEGDLYLDVSSARLDLYRKDSSGWYVIAYIKGDQGGGVSGGEGAGGGGGNIIVQPGPGEPTTDGDGNVLNEGDLWYDPTTGWLYVYHQNEWVAVAGEPPVIMSATPPDQDYGEHPIQEGSLWFDTEQLALYIAGKDSSDNMVWITAIPADRSAVDDTVNIPFRPTGFATDGSEQQNPVTGITYKYNAPKNQWIDKAPKMGGAYYQDLAPDPNVDNLRPGDLWIDSGTHNLYVWTGDTWSQVNPGCNSNPKVHFQPSAPNGTQHIRGDLWIDSDTNKLFTWNGEIWMEVGASCGGTGTEEFVKIVGDTMTGPLILHDENGNQAEINISSQAVHKAYVDDQDAKLQQEIINLEEEINNIQASVEGGRWNFTVNPSVTAGEFRMSTGSFTAAAQTITINRKDLAASDHYWSQSEIGHNLEILDQTIGSTNNALYVITDITKDIGAEQTIFELELVRGTGSPSNNKPCVIKTFELQGGDPTAYVRKVGDEMSGKLHLQDDQGNPQVITDDDQAVHKLYVDEQLFGQNRECVELNGGKLCGGEPMPRFYDVPNWSYKQKNSAGVVHGKQNVIWWEYAKRWIYTTTNKVGAYNGLQIYISKTSLLDDTWDLFLEARTNNSTASVRLNFKGVGNKYLYYVQYFGYSSAQNNNLYGLVYRVDKDAQTTQLLARNSLSGFDITSSVIDDGGNLGMACTQTTYNSSNRTFTHTRYLYFFADETGAGSYRTITSYVSNTQSAAFTTNLLPRSVMRGFYVSFSSQTHYNWHTTHTTDVYYFDPYNNFMTTNVTSKLFPDRTNFSYTGSTGDYGTAYCLKLKTGDGTNPAPYTKITYNRELEHFYCVQQYSDSDKYTRDGSMGFKVFRSKQYKYEDVAWNTLDWLNLFTFSRGAEVVLDSPNSYTREIDYFAGELVTVTWSGVAVFSGTAGEPIIKHPYGKVWGSVDEGETWQFRETELRNDDGTLIPNTRAYINYSAENAAPLPDGGDYINLNFTKFSDTNDEFYNDEGEITNYIGNDDELTVGFQRYDLPFNIYTGSQALFWNGDQINLPADEIDLPATQIAYAGTEGLTALTTTAQRTTTESSVTDGYIYTLRFSGDGPSDPTLTTSSYYGLFLTPAWIKAVTKNIPSDATELEVYDMSGEWKNQENNGYHQTVSTANVAAATFNGINGVAVRFDSNSVSSSYKSWKANIAVTLRYVTTFGESGLPILPLN